MYVVPSSPGCTKEVWKTATSHGGYWLGPWLGTLRSRETTGRSISSEGTTMRVATAESPGEGLGNGADGEAGEVGSADATGVAAGSDGVAATGAALGKLPGSARGRAVAAPVGPA